MLKCVKLKKTFFSENGGHTWQLFLFKNKVYRSDLGPFNLAIAMVYTFFLCFI